MKKLIVTASMLFSMVTFGQSVSDGTYFVSGDQISKIEIVNRRNGNMMVTYHYMLGKESKEVLFNPVEGSGDYTAEVKKNRVVITTLDGALCMLTLDDINNIIEKHALGATKKEMSQGRKKLGIKSAMSKEMGSLLGKKNAKPKSQSKEFWVENPTSDFHKQHVGEIVFFSEKPTVGKEDLSKIKTDFKVGEQIWAVAYLPTTFNKSKYIKELVNPFYDAYGNYHYWLSIGMDMVEEGLSAKEMEVFNQCTVKTVKESELDNNYIVFQILPTSADNFEMNVKGAPFLLKRMGERLDPYKHTLRISLTDGESKPEEEFFSGEITFDTKSGTESLIELSSSIKEKVLDAKPLPSAVRKDAALEAEMLSQIKLFARNKGWDQEFHRVIITMDWRVLNDDYGNIKGKYAEGDVLFTSSEGCGSMNFGFLKEYQGNGNYSSYMKQHTTGPRQELSCKKVK